MHTSSKALRRRLAAAVMALSAALVVTAASTFAWYIYNTAAHTTRVHMAAGASVALAIANQEDGNYSSSARLEEFSGSLNPVSTDKIANGFQKVLGFTNGTENRSTLLANLFGASIQNDHDYYITSLWLKSEGDPFAVYLSDIGYEDSDPEDNPISTAIRVGLRVPATGEEFIFAINPDEHIEQVEYNTEQGEPGHVLDSTKTDGSTVDFSENLLTKANFCVYDDINDACSLLPGSKQLLTATDTPAQVEVYIWLEGCDEDCTNALCAMTLKNLSLSFGGIQT